MITEYLEGIAQLTTVSTGSYVRALCCCCVTEGGAQHGGLHQNIPDKIAQATHRERPVYSFKANDSVEDRCSRLTTKNTSLNRHKSYPSRIQFHGAQVNTELSSSPPPPSPRIPQANTLRRNATSSRRRSLVTRGEGSGGSAADHVASTMSTLN